MLLGNDVLDMERGAHQPLWHQAVFVAALGTSPNKLALLGIHSASSAVLREYRPGFGLHEREHIDGFHEVFILQLLAGGKRALVCLICEQIQARLHFRIDLQIGDALRDFDREALRKRGKELVGSGTFCDGRHTTIIRHRDCREKADADR